MYGWPQFAIKTKKVQTRPDIVVMEFKTPFALNQNIAPASLPTKVNNYDVICKVSGWGSTAYCNTWQMIYDPERCSKTSNDLKVAQVRLLEDGFCKRHYVLAKVKDGNFLKKFEICAAKNTGTVCRGDSGGPLVCQGMKSHYATYFS